MTQKEALDILKMGHNAFITGAAGSGKTHLLNEYIKYLKQHKVGLGITASTGIAATHMGGMTIHAWSGLGIRDRLTKKDIEDLSEKSYLWKRFEEAKVLIIDEVSMLHHFRLDLLDQLARNFKNVDAPFGGLQVIFCGDFFQLPPVSRSGEPPASFAYEAKVWRDLDLKICYLEEQWRQQDQNYLKLLNAIRSGELETEAIEILQSRFNQTLTAIDPTRLYTHNADVDLENERELAKIDDDLIEMPMTATGRENLAAILKKGCLAPENLRLKKGAKVMFVKNNFEVGYVNGTLGLVEECDDFGIKVRVRSGKLIKVEPASWAIEEDGKVKAQIMQYPLRLAWAITVHKSQGMSLDAAEVDLSQSFERGMGYVALSRVRSLDGLVLRGLNDMALRVSEEVLNHDAEFRLSSKKVVAEWQKMSDKQKEEAKREFLARIGADKEKKSKKPDTVSETKKLAEAGWTVAKIARERGLKPETIISHLEEIKTREPDFDFSAIGKGILAARLKKIQAALRASGVEEGGGYRLTPAKIKLGAGYTYEEIRLGRLLMS
ncbi:MAG: AAA family ATPase [Candidatus Paceibacterota bacterium]|jgi:ATP-dependent exoDNAse (exonuclease V) alpha subunit